MLRRTLTAAVMTAAALTTTVTPAHADVHTCLLVGSATFSNTLTTSFSRGTIYFDYAYNCVAVESDGGTGLLTGRNTLTIDYEGSCLTASLSGPGSSTGVLVGGVAGATVSLATGDGVRTYVLVPDSLNPCAMRTATFAGTSLYGAL